MRDPDWVGGLSVWSGQKKNWIRTTGVESKVTTEKAKLGTEERRVPHQPLFLLFS